MQELKKKIHGSDHPSSSALQTTTLIISKKEMNDIMKIVQALKDSNILLKGVTKTFKNEIKKQKGGFLSRLLVTLGASLLGNLLSGKGIVRAGYGHPSKKGKGIVRTGSGRPSSSASQNKKGKGIVRAGYGNKMDF